MVLYRKRVRVPKNKRPRCLMDRRGGSSSASASLSSPSSFSASGSVALEASGTMVPRMACWRNARSGVMVAIIRSRCLPGYSEHTGLLEKSQQYKPTAQQWTAIHSDTGDARKGKSPNAA
jgi:hypothetical protein